MNKKIITGLLFCLIAYPAQSEITNKLLKNATILTGSESIVYNSTPLTNKNELLKLKEDLKSKKKYLKVLGPRLAKNNSKPRPKHRFKGSAEEIYNNYVESVVFIGNEKKNGSGTGFVINHKGQKIVTNWHVVEGAENVRVWLKPKDIKGEAYLINNTDSYNGKVIKINKEKDLALIEVKGLSKNITGVPFGKFDDVKIGETVFAIGHPGDLIWSFNSGMVSQLRSNHKWKYKNSSHFADVIQTQTPINPGNSGGPLFNKNKKLVGVNTFTATGENLNFAVSVDDLILFLKEPTKKKEKSKYIQKKKKQPTWITKKNKKKPASTINKKYPNAEKIDLNKNGITDAWFVDEDKNGTKDTVLIDQNEDGIIEVVGFDDNEDKNFEIFFYDDDLDGNADRAEIDQNEDGVPEKMAYDYDQDGEWDKYEDIS